MGYVVCSMSGVCDVSVKGYMNVCWISVWGIYVTCTRYWVYVLGVFVP